MIGVGVVAASTASLASTLAHVEGGTELALRLGARGHLQAGLALTRAIRRTWWPIAVALGSFNRRARRVLMWSVAVSLLADRLPGPRPSRPLTTVGLDLVADLAYGFGVWEGMWRQRSWAAIRPELVL